MTDTATPTGPYRVLYDGRDRKVFLRTRDQGIGASDIAAVLGFSKFKTPYDVWEDKTGRKPYQPQTEYMEWGIALENPIAQRFQSRHGRLDSPQPIGKVLPSPGVLQSLAYPYLLATPDREVQRFDNGRIVPLEIKTGSAWVASDWDEDVPDYYQAQSQAQQFVQFGMDNPDEGLVVPLLGGNRMPEPYTLKSQPSFWETIVEEVGKFWVDHVLKDVPPRLTLADDVNRIYPAMRGKKFVATPRLEELVAERNILQPKMSADGKRDDAIKAEIKLAMLDATHLVSAEDETRVLLTWDLPAKAPSEEVVFDVDALKASDPETFAKFSTRRLKPQNRSMSFK